jgi:hypothetical protein
MGWDTGYCFRVISTLRRARARVLLPRKTSSGGRPVPPELPPRQWGDIRVGTRERSAGTMAAAGLSPDPEVTPG